MYFTGDPSTNTTAKIPFEVTPASFNITFDQVKVVKSQDDSPDDVRVFWSVVADNYKNEGWAGGLDENIPAGSSLKVGKRLIPKDMPVKSLVSISMLGVEWDDSQGDEVMEALEKIKTIMTAMSLFTEVLLDSLALGLMTAHLMGHTVISGFGLIALETFITTMTVMGAVFGAAAFGLMVAIFLIEEIDGPGSDLVGFDNRIIPVGLLQTMTEINGGSYTESLYLNDAGIAAWVGKVRVEKLGGTVLGGAGKKYP